MRKTPLIVFYRGVVAATVHRAVFHVAAEHFVRIDDIVSVRDQLGPARIDNVQRLVLKRRGEALDTTAQIDRNVAKSHARAVAGIHCSVRNAVVPIERS